MCCFILEIYCGEEVSGSRLHFGGAFGGDCHHWYFGWVVIASSPGCSRSCEKNAMSKQSQAAGIGNT
jgi:hypothetical protein